MKNLIPFDYSGKTVRIVIREDGSPCWVGKDSCIALGFRKYRDMLSTLDPDERVSISVDTPGGIQTMIAVTEPGLYRLLSKASKKKANKFQRWVFHAVLPSIRKTGSYSTQPKSQIDLIIESAQVLKNLEQRISNIETVQHEAQQKLIEFPEAKTAPAEKSIRATINEYVRAYAISKGLMHAVVWAKLYREYNYRYHTNLERRANSGSKINLIEKDGNLEELYGLCHEILPLES